MKRVCLRIGYDKTNMHQKVLSKTRYDKTNMHEKGLSKCRAAKSTRAHIKLEDTIETLPNFIYSKSKRKISIKPRVREKG